MFRQLSPQDLEGRVRRAFTVERLLTKVGWVMLAIGTLAIAALLLALAVGSLSWQRAGAAIFGVLAATVLSGATAYGAGTNVGMAAVTLQLRLEERDPPQP
ncbi:MAG: hypothetical protein H6524_13635 [Actinobacteria bacterium]|jgi:predicted anti-sigma-YlaC factor YlaD|nr:hypothetical protein [Actinomycetota bacterium]MCB9429844.1 hypothetical protein [Actinomycetota bacterium]HPQ85624.1 hypothetical protein [Actinomycetota bacterium]